MSSSLISVLSSLYYSLDIELHGKELLCVAHANIYYNKKIPKSSVFFLSGIIFLLSTCNNFLWSNYDMTLWFKQGGWGPSLPPDINKRLPPISNWRTGQRQLTVTSTGNPQGCVLSPILTLSTQTKSDCCQKTSRLSSSQITLLF